MSEQGHAPYNPGAQPPQGAPQVPPPQPQNEKTWALFCHLLAFAGFFVPLGNIIGPLVIWLIKKDAMPVVNDQGKESLNFQISVTIYGIVSAILARILIGYLLLLALVVFAIVFVIIATVKASKGHAYRYPLTIRFLK